MGELVLLRHSCELVLSKYEGGQVHKVKEETGIVGYWRNSLNKKKRKFFNQHSNIPSTIMDVSDHPFTVVREGAIPSGEIFS